MMGLIMYVAVTAHHPATLSCNGPSCIGVRSSGDQNLLFRILAVRVITFSTTALSRHTAV